jgi:hypothetical protein
MDSPVDIDTESDVFRGVVMGVAFLVGLALNLDPERRTLALAVFGGGAVAFFGLAALATIDDEYASPQLRWYLFAGWGVLLFAIGLWTQSTVGGVGGIVIAVYAAVRAWLFDALEDADDGRPPDGDGDDAETGKGEHPSARTAVTPNRDRGTTGQHGRDDGESDDGDGATDHAGGDT